MRFTKRIIELQPKIIDYYLIDKKTIKDISFLCGIKVETARKVLRYNNIEIRGSKKNLINEIFDRLKVIRFTKLDNSQKAMWECLCECGNKTEVRGSDLISKKVKSCGCYHSETSKENIKLAHKKYPKSYGFKGIEDLSGGYLSQIKHGAFIRGFEYSISKEYLWDLFLKQNRKCALTGLDIYFGIYGNKKQNGGRNQTASLDRVDSTRGYVEGNVQWVHKDINNIKQDYSMKELLNYCKLIYEKHFIQN